MRYFGVFAPNQKWRKEVVPAPKVIDGCEQERVYRLPWAELLKRTFGLDRELCKRCHYKLEAVSVVLSPSLARETLKALGIESRPVVLDPMTSRGSPTKMEFEDISQAPNDW